MEWLNGFLESSFWAYAIAFWMLVIGAIFVIIYSSDIATRKDLRKQAAYFNELLREKDAEIAKLKAEKLKIGAEKFAVEMDNKTLRTVLGNEAHKVRQLVKGAKTLGIDVDNE
jgi:acid phosphatase family membrane protein YuiD